MPGTGPEPGRFTCSLIRARGGEGAGLGERRRVGTGWLSREKRSSASPASGDGDLAATLGIPGVPYGAPGPGSKSAEQDTSRSPSRISCSYNLFSGGTW